MGWLWLADRGSGVAAYVALVASAFTGIAYGAQSWGPVYRWARAVHNGVSYTTVGLLLLHAGLGAVDTLLVTGGQSPAPGYGTPFLLAGVAVGLGALVLTLVATLAFADPKRFERPWKPGLVHALAYGGFAFATLHAAAVGTDVRDVAVQLVAAVGFLLAATVLFRRRSARKAAPSSPPAPPG